MHQWPNAHLDDCPQVQPAHLVHFPGRSIQTGESVARENIKKNILLLSRFIDKRIFDTMAFPGKQKLEIIIKINQNIAAGLAWFRILIDYNAMNYK
jgi:hypothetical protein